MTVRINPLTVKCDYCQAAPTKPCIQRGTRDPRNEYRGRRLRPGHYHDTRTETAREQLLVS